MEFNLFKNGKLYQWDRNLIVTSDTNVLDTFCVSDKFIKMLEKMQGEVTLNGNNAIIKKGKSRYKEQIMDYVLPYIETNFTSKISVDANTLKIAKQFVGNDNRPILTGIYIQPNGNIVATDSYVMYRKYNGECNEKGIVLSTDVIPFLNGNVDIEFNNRVAKIVCNNKTYITNLIDGNYPVVDKIYNTSFSELFEYDYEEFKNQALFDKDDNYYVIMQENVLKLNDTYQTELNANANFKVSQKQLSKVLNNIDTLKIEYNGRLLKINDEFVIMQVK